MTQRSFLLMSTLIYLLGQYVSAEQKQTVAMSKSGQQRKSRFFSVEPEDGKVEINLDLSVPFMSIPLEERKGHPGSPMSLLNINPKGLAIFGTLLAMTAIIIPLFYKEIPQNPTEPVPPMYHHYAKEHKRANRALDFWTFDESMNEVFSQDGPVTPCVQRLVCSAVAAASRSNPPSSIDKIIDGMSSHRWFKQMTNGTTIEEAIATGRKGLGPEECSATYKKCALSEEMMANFLKIVGI